MRGNIKREKQGGGGGGVVAGGRGDGSKKGARRGPAKRRTNPKNKSNTKKNLDTSSQRTRRQRRKRGRKTDDSADVDSKQQLTKQQQEPTSLQPLRTSSIHRAWKQPLGGLLRWYVHQRFTQDANMDVAHAERELDAMWIQNGMKIDDLREAILRRLCDMSSSPVPPPGGAAGNHLNTTQTKWIDLVMVIENENFTEQEREAILAQSQYKISHDKKGIQLPVTLRPGEGPAHLTELWQTILVPDWAEGKSYYFQVNNRSPLDLSCEMTVDGHRAAWNAPVGRTSVVNIKPDAHRYYATHKWVLKPAQRIKLQDTVTPQHPNQEAALRSRYNNVRRPNTQEAGQQRVSEHDYPDPTTAGWTFTGSSAQVEFFEKQLNFGTVTLDFDVVTGAIATVLHHPATGPKQLFRNSKVSPETYLQILQNPRAHTNSGAVGTHNQEPATELKEEDDAMMESGEGAETMDNHEDPSASIPLNEGTVPTPYFAKNDAYKFEKAGHANRATSMARLEPTEEFKAWETANRKRLAYVHANFFVSIPRRRAGRVILPKSRDKGEPEALPRMEPIVDVKAAEKAVFSTKFHSTGPCAPKRSNKIRMERISGLNDKPEWGTGPVFQSELYYRAEHIATDDRDADEGEDEDDFMDEDEVELAGKLRGEVPLDDYKSEKLGQLHSWHSANIGSDPREADEIFNECKVRIQQAQSTSSVDEAVKHYWDWHQKQQWKKPTATTNM